MKRYAADYFLDGITEADFQNWKHHPVTKLYLRFLRDYEQMMKDEQIGKLRTSTSSPDQYTLGTFTGAINAVNDMANPEYESIVKFYSPDAEEEQD